jgi:hypothetical protein
MQWENRHLLQRLSFQLGDFNRDGHYPPGMTGLASRAFASWLHIRPAGNDNYKVHAVVFTTVAVNSMSTPILFAPVSLKKEPLEGNHVADDGLQVRGLLESDRTRNANEGIRVHRQDLSRKVCVVAEAMNLRRSTSRTHRVSSTLCDYIRGLSSLEEGVP